MRSPHRIVRCIITLAVALACVSPLRAGESWQLDSAHTNVTFSVAHMGVSRVSGSFRDTSGSGSFDGKTVGSAQVEAIIQTASVDTRNEKRDGHLKGADFLDVQKFPTITFKSKRFRQTSGRKFQLTGDLTVHGVTKTVVLGGEFSEVIKDPFGKTRVGATASTTINRKDFGLGWNKIMESGGLLVGEDVLITIEVEFVKGS